MADWVVDELFDLKATGTVLRQNKKMKLRNGFNEDRASSYRKRLAEVMAYTLLVYATLFTDHIILIER